MQTRRPRFDRGELKQNLQLTDRDLSILQLLAHHRFLRSTQIAELIGGSDKKVIERLGQLFYAGYVDRPEHQLEYFRPGGGSAPVIYALTDEGARVLAEKNLVSLQRLRDLNRRNGDSKRPFIHHSLAVAEIAISLVAATRNTDTRMRAQLHDELLATLPQSVRAQPKPFLITVPRVRYKDEEQTVSVEPDLAFGLVYPNGTRRCYLVERCRGTMPVKRQRLTQTSIFRKLLAYETARRREQHKQQLSWANFRVLLVLDSPTRAANIIAEIADDHFLRVSPLFLVTDITAINASGNILKHQWRTPTKAMTLLD
jgi:Replication-relaxation